ncbi:hotdog family protein [Dactylosporangium cerinum]
MQVQVWVGGPQESGRRPVNIYSRPETDQSDGDGDGDVWVRHATGVVSPAMPTPAFDLTVWPPQGAVPVDVDGVYERLAESGFGYGPVFQGMQAVWRRDGEVFAEIALPEPAAEEAGLFAIHPALLDAARHPTLLDAKQPDSDGIDGDLRLPFAWSGVSLFAAGAAVLRVRLTQAGDDGVALAVADGTGMPVAMVESLVLRPVTAEQLNITGGVAPAFGDRLFQVDWLVPAGAAAVSAEARWAVVGPDGSGLAAGLRSVGAGCSSIRTWPGCGRQSLMARRCLIWCWPQTSRSLLMVRPASECGRRRVGCWSFCSPGWPMTSWSRPGWWS